MTYLLLRRTHVCRFPRVLDIVALWCEKTMPTWSDIIISLLNCYSVCVLQDMYLISHHAKKEDPVSVESCCARRRARFWKCAKRRQRRRSCFSFFRSSSCTLMSSSSSSGGVEGCPFTVYCCKLQLPPPLPLIRRRRLVEVVDGENEGKPILTQDEGDDEVEEVIFSTLLTTNTLVDSECSRKRILENQQQNLSALNNEETLVGISPSFKIIEKAPRPARAISKTHLIDLVRMQHWDLLLRNAPIQRRQAKYRDTDGLYPLHWAAAGSPPVEVVQLILEAYPSTIHKPDKEGSLPLHFATCYAASLPVVELLLRHYPEACMHKDRFGRTPLYHAADKAARQAILEVLSDGHAELFTTHCRSRRRDGTRQTPLSLLWANVLMDRRTRTTCQGKTWDKAVWMLERAFEHHLFTQGKEKPLVSSLLTAAIQMDSFLPEPVVPLIVKSFPTLIHNARENPLLVTATSPTERWETLAELLIQSNPTLVSPNVFHETLRAGRHPIPSMWKAAPDVLDYCDIVTGLPPALLTATLTKSLLRNYPLSTVNDKNRNHELNDSYELLSSKQSETSKFTINQSSTDTVLGNGRDTSFATLDKCNTSHLQTIFVLLRANPMQISLKHPSY